MSPLPSWMRLLAGTDPQTPLQLTMWLLWVVFGLALAVGIVYVALLLWSLAKHLSHEPLARDRPVTSPGKPRAPPKLG